MRSVSRPQLVCALLIMLSACAEDPAPGPGDAVGAGDGAVTPVDARLGGDGAPDAEPQRDAPVPDGAPGDGGEPPDARPADAATDVAQLDMRVADAVVADAVVADAAVADAAVADAVVADGAPPDAVVADGAPPDAAARDEGPDVPCLADCGGRTCGDDGCGGSCGGCGAGRVCEDGECACDARLPAGWPARFVPFAHNPLLVATAGRPLQGADNVYAPDIHPHAGGWLMWYGAQGGDGHDRIFLATARDGMEWRKWPADGDPQPVLDRGRANHINDPSVVRVGDTWRMYYTEAPQAEDDVIALATGASPTGFQREGYVLRPGPAGAWDSVKVGRPSVLYEDGVYRLWYDGTGPGGRRHVGLATSADGVRFVRHPGNPIFFDAGAVDVKRVGGVYVMLREGGDGTRWATSTDGTCWVDRGLLFGRSGAAYDAHGQVTPFLWLRDGAPAGVWFGGASVAAWNRNRIAAAFPDGIAPAPGGGCTACLAPGLTCAESCPGDGTCGAPGSAEPGRCCACAPSPCAACLGAHDDCHGACVAAGAAGGWCAHPGSAEPGRCCACYR